MPELTPETLWLAVGYGGQALFASRFLVQWIATERRQQSVVPVVFWYLSLGGGLLLLSYSIWIREPVFMVGQSGGILVYSRNLWYVHRQRAAEAD